MKRRLIIIGAAVCFTVLLTVSAFAAGDAPPMNARGFISLALMSGALAASVGLVVYYMKKFAERNREERERPPRLQKHTSPQKKSPQNMRKNRK